MFICKNCGKKSMNTYLVTRNGKSATACFDCAELKKWEAK